MAAGSQRSGGGALSVLVSHSMAHTSQDMVHALRRGGTEIVFRQLGPVDCVVSLNKAVIRVRPRDVEPKSPSFARLMDTIEAARRQYQCLVLLVLEEEGKHAPEGHHRERQQTIQAHFVRDVCRMQGVELLWGATSEEAAQVVRALAQSSPNRLPASMDWLPDACPGVQALLQVPHWSYVAVCAALTKLGSLQAVLNATPPQLESVSGLARTQLEQLARFAATTVALC